MSTMKTAARRCYGFTLFLAVSLALPTTARGADLVTALDAAPADAELVMVVPSMQAFSDAVAEVAALFEIDEPDMTDALSAFKRDMGFTAGIEDEGPAIIVVTDAQGLIERTDPKVVMLVPVSDYAAFVTQLGGQPTGVTPITMGHNQDDGHAKELEGYAVMAEHADTVEAYTLGRQGVELIERVGRYAEDAAGDAQFAVYLDVKRVAPPLKAVLEAGVAAYAAEYEQEQAAGELPNPMLAAINLPGIMKLYEGALRMMLDSADAVMFTARFGGDGFVIEHAVQLSEGGPLAGYLTGQAGDVTRPFEALPDQPYLFASTLDHRAIDVRRMLTDMVDRVEAELGETPLVSAWIEIARPSIEMYAGIDGSAQAVYAPDMMAAMITGSFVKSLTVHETNDADGAMSTWKQSIESVPTLFERADVGLNATVTWTDNALTLGGQPVAQYDLRFEVPPEVRSEMGPAAMFAGNAGQTGYVTTVDGLLLTTTTAEPALIQAGIEAAANENGLGANPLLTEAREQLPANPVVEAYVSLDGLAGAANPLLAMMAGGTQLTVPESLPPVTVGLGVDGRALGVRVVAPRESVRFIRDVGNEVEAAMTQRNEAMQRDN